MRSLKFFSFLSIFIIILAFSFNAFGQKKKTRVKRAKTISTVNSSLTDSEISDGFKEGLTKGIESAVTSLGGKNGFLDNLRVKIPLPKSLQKLEKGLRLAGQGDAVNDFVASLNHAAEKAVPVAIDVFVDALKQMTSNDARTILLSGQDDAATQYFRRTTEENLRGKFRPIVEKCTDETGVTANYKSMVGKAGFAAKLVGQDATDLDGYVTQKALDGLFLIVADEEKSLRKDPLGRTTNLLKKVFGVLI